MKRIRKTTNGFCQRRDSCKEMESVALKDTVRNPLAGACIQEQDKERDGLIGEGLKNIPKTPGLPKKGSSTTSFYLK